MVKSVRRKYVLNCSTCKTIKQADGFGPPHDADERCESGKHKHCSCDTCF